MQKKKAGPLDVSGRSFGLKPCGSPQFKLRLVGVVGRGLGTAAHFSFFLGFEIGSFFVVLAVLELAM